LKFWDTRYNLKNRPSLANRTIRVIEEVMDRKEVSIGVAIEKLIQSPTLWDEIVSELSSFDKSFLEKDR